MLLLPDEEVGMGSGSELGVCAVSSAVGTSKRRVLHAAEEGREGDGFGGDESPFLRGTYRKE